MAVEPSDHFRGGVEHGFAGGTARLVMLPEEGHGYSARESVLHTAVEMITWFDRHVKNASTEPPGGE